MSLREELWKLKDLDEIDVIVAEAATGGTISIIGSYDAYEHLTESGAGQIGSGVGPVIASLPYSIRESLIASYGEGPNGLSPRELNLIKTGAQIAVLALERYVQSTEPGDEPSV
jgi:hypothetical protein